ncbi:MAG: polysaccharide biosynthesis protein [Clostridia bacterium]|nr:polysaccharide biosynthesis protein [Clostridia bacterium]
MTGSAKQQTRKKQTLLNGALVLIMSTVIVKLISIFYKIPITNILGTVGRSYYNSAYAIFIPVYSVALAGLPTAMSRLVAHYMALGEYRHVRQTLRVTRKLFILTGLLGTLALALLAWPYAVSAKKPEAFSSILMLAPCVFFCCVMSTYRGYYNGLRNMTPTAVSEVIEAVGKFAVGVILARYVVDLGLRQYAATGVVFGTACASDSEAMSAIYPYAAAAAVLGVTLSTALAFFYLWLRYRIKGDGITKAELATAPAPPRQKALAKQLLAVALPIVASTIIFNLTNLIDSWTIQNRLGTITATHLDVLRAMYGDALRAGAVLDGDVADYLYGAYEIASDFRNLLPSITVTFGISAIPVLSEAWTIKDHRAIRSSIESVIRMSMMISMPLGMIMGILAKPILTVFYSGNASVMSAIDISSATMMIYCVTAFIFSITQPLTNMLQAIGRMDIPLISLAVGAIFKVGINFFLISIPEVNIYGAIVGTLVSYVLVSLIDVIALVKIAKVKVSIRSVFTKPLFCSLIGGAAAWAVYGMVSRLLSSIPALASETRHVNYVSVALVVAAVFAVAFYVIFMFLTRAVEKDDVKMLPKGNKIVKILEKYGFME